LKGGKDSGGVKGRRVITGALNSGISKRKKERKRERGKGEGEESGRARGSTTGNRGSPPYYI